MTEERLREILENVGHQSVNNIGVKCYYPIAVQLAMKQAVNEAIDEYKSKGTYQDGFFAGQEYEAKRTDKINWISIKDHQPKLGEQIIGFFSILSMDHGTTVLKTVMHRDGERPGFSGENSTCRLTHWIPYCKPDQLKVK